MNKTATIYIRARGDGPSIDWQRQVCCEAAKRLGVTITQEYVERSEGSARPERERMMRDLTGDSRSDLLLLTSYDRLTRDYRTWGGILARLDKANVFVVAADHLGDAASSSWGVEHAQMMQSLLLFHASSPRRGSNASSSPAPMQEVRVD